MNRHFQRRCPTTGLKVPCRRASRAPRGFSLIELIIFIVVIAIMAVALMSAFSTTMQNTPTAGLATKATQLAQERMELILAQRRAMGFATFADPCAPGPGPAACTPPSGYSVAVTIAPSWNGDTNYRVITVSVSGTGAATATALVANY